MTRAPSLPGPVPGHPWAPDPTWPVLATYWARLAAGRLSFPRCTACGRFVWYPQPLCPACQSTNLEWEDVGSAGRIFSYTVLHRPFLPGFAEDAPLPLLLVELDDAPGVRLITSTVDGSAGGVEIDAAVQIEICAVAQDVHLPFARVVSGRPVTS